MGCSGSKADGGNPEDVRRNKDIEKQLAADRVAAKVPRAQLLQDGVKKLRY